MGTTWQGKVRFTDDFPAVFTDNFTSVSLTIDNQSPQNLSVSKESDIMFKIDLQNLNGTINSNSIIEIDGIEIQEFDDDFRAHRDNEFIKMSAKYNDDYTVNYDASQNTFGLYILGPNLGTELDSIVSTLYSYPVKPITITEPDDQNSTDPVTVLKNGDELCLYLDSGLEWDTDIPLEFLVFT